MMRTLLVILFLCCPAFACINEYEPEGHPSTVFGQYVERDWQARVAELERLQKQADFKVRNDYAAALMRVGRAAEAVAVLQAVEKDHPGEYIVAANLGTAFELSGDLNQAYVWIEEGIKRNAQAHDGTEWLHLRILEARKELKRDEHWLEKHQVLTEADLKDRARLEKALRYQLHERMWFVKPPDPVVADLLVELARIVDKPGHPREAAEMYQLALNYKPAQPDFARERRDILAQEVRANESAGKTAAWTVGLGSLGILVLFVFLLKMRR